MKVANFCYSWAAFHMHAFPSELKLEATKLKKRRNLNAFKLNQLKLHPIETVRVKKICLRIR